MTAPAVFFMSKKIIFEKFCENFSKLCRFLYNIPTGICILYKRRKRLFFFFFFYSRTHRYIYINVFCPLIKKKKKKNCAVSFDVPDLALLPFPDPQAFFRVTFRRDVANDLYEDDSARGRNMLRVAGF